MKMLAFVILGFASVALADDFKTINGKEYKHARVSRVEPDGIVLVTKSGISKVYFTELPKEVQERFHYDATKAAAYSAEQAAPFLKQQEESRRKLAEERAFADKRIAEQKAVKRARAEKEANAEADLKRSQEQFQAAQQATYASDAPAVTGSAYVTRGTGDSFILRDLEIFICKPSVLTVWDATYKGSKTRLQLLTGLVEFERELPKHVVGSTRTDLDGKFKVTALPAGNYAVFAHFETSSATVCWLIPIKMEPGTPVGLTLSNTTAKEIKNDR